MTHSPAPETFAAEGSPAATSLDLLRQAVDDMLQSRVVTADKAVPPGMTTAEMSASWGSAAATAAAQMVAAQRPVADELGATCLVIQPGTVGLKGQSDELWWWGYKRLIDRLAQAKVSKQYQ